jgi:predicted protein tyrosine phosphatase
MIIQIMSRRAAAKAIRLDPDYPIIAIGETYNNDVDEMITSVAKNCLCLKFEDIEHERVGYDTVKEEHIEQAVEWAKDKDKLIVACRAGISRSSAMAYIIASSRVGPEEAVKILNMEIHQPNRLVVALGANVLGSNKINEVLDEWMKELYSKFLS